MAVVCYGQPLERRCKCLAVLFEREQLGTELYFVAVENDVEQGQARACVVYHLQQTYKSLSLPAAVMAMVAAVCWTSWAYTWFANQTFSGQVVSMLSTVSGFQRKRKIRPHAGL